MSDFQVGDVVYLKSGGPAMTVTEYIAESGWARLAWFLNGEIQKASIEGATITKDDPNVKPKNTLTGGVRTF